MSTTMWPSSAAAPTQPRYSRPPSTSPPPIPVPIVSIATSAAPLAAPGARLGPDRAVGVVVDLHRQPEALGHEVGEGQVGERQVDGLDRDPGPAVERAGDPEADRVDFATDGIASLLYGFDHRLDEGGLVQPEGLPARSMVDGESFWIDGSGQEFRPAQIDADHTAGRHCDHDTPFAMDEEKPNYTRYRSRPKLFGKRSDGPRDGLDDLRGGHPRPEQGGKRRLRDRFTFWRVLGYVALAAVGWVLISLLLFLISAQVQRQKVNDAAGSTLSDSGFPLTSPNNILVLGSDARTKGTKEPGRERRRPQPLGHDPADAGRRREVRRGSRSRATRSRRSPATAPTRSTPPTRTAARASRSRPSRGSSA